MGPYADKQYTVAASPTYAAPPAANAVPPDSTLVGRLRSLQQAAERAHALAGATEALADRIAGSRPEKNDGGKPSAVPNGLYEEFGNAIENLTSALSRVHTALGRAETTIG